MRIFQELLACSSTRIVSTTPFWHCFTWAGDEWRTWKSFDWAAMERLHEEAPDVRPGWQDQSVVFSEEGLRRSEALFWELSGH